MERTKLGVFDSGLGGLTVLNEILKHNNGLAVTYFGDTARVPYGSRTPETIARYAEQDVRFLLSKGVEAIVIACGTVSAIGLSRLTKAFSVPIIGVIEAACDAACQATKTGHIAVLGTKATIGSHAYSARIHTLAPACRVDGYACPLLVPLIENGFSAQDPITMLTLERYLASIRETDVDTVILGCTHYPFLSSAIQSILPNVTAINIGAALANALPYRLQLSASDLPSEVAYYVSDPDTGFCQIANGFLDAVHADHIDTVNIEQF